MPLASEFLCFGNVLLDVVFGSTDSALRCTLSRARLLAIHCLKWFPATLSLSRSAKIQYRIMRKMKTCIREGRWLDDEHERFLKALRIYGSNWKAVELAVGTRTATQARSHAQKHFIKENKKKKEVEAYRKRTGEEVNVGVSTAVQYGAGVVFLPPLL